jgi:hypothetical protein
VLTFYDADADAVPVPERTARWAKIGTTVGRGGAASTDSMYALKTCLKKKKHELRLNKMKMNTW